MAIMSFALSVRLPGGPHLVEEVLRTMREAGGVEVSSVDGGPAAFDIAFDYEGDGEEAAAWAAMCDLGAAYPGAVLLTVARR